MAQEKSTTPVFHSQFRHPANTPRTGKQRVAVSALLSGWFRIAFWEPKFTSTRVP